jgi:hypothetical protein
MDQARERLIHARATHLDSLVAKLHEPRVKRVIQPLIAGDLPDADATYDDDASYVRDLGLIARRDPVRVANPIYKEVIVRVLGSRTEAVITADPRSFILDDGRLDMPKLLHEFAAFWIENGEILTSGTVYHEVGCQLVIMAFLQRIINGGGHIDREYGIGRRRIDLLIRKPHTGPDDKPAVQREALELKVWHPGRPDPLPDGLTQLQTYLDRLGLTTGTLVIFDRRPDAAPINERTTFTTEHTPNGHTVTLLRA